MAHFAQINEQKIVVEVIVIANAEVDDLPFPESEPLGQAFIASCNIGGEWVQTSYNANFRNIYSAIGDYFNPLLGEYGEFVPPDVEP